LETKDKTVAMYPWSIVSMGIYPKHLGPEWNEGIKQTYFYRANELKPKLKQLKKGSKEYQEIDDEQGAYKLALNGGGFGKLGSSFNWQFDELAKYKVTIGGELKMLMLIEELYLANIELVSVNTDGVVIHYSEEEKEIVNKIWKEWENLTTYTLEDTYYNKIIFSSVNDYIAEIINPETKKTLYFKYKGDFEIDKEFHKNNSQRIVPIALKEYFINTIPVKETIINHINRKGYDWNEEKEKWEIKSHGIFDFCIGKKGTSSNYKLVKNGKIYEFTDKVIRYYISNNNTKLFKEYTDGKKKGEYEAVNKGFNTEMFMEYYDSEDYNINYNYYINECNKIIKEIEKKRINIEQLKLF